MIEALKYFDKDGEGWVTFEKCSESDNIEICARNERDLMTHFFIIDGKELLRELPLLFREGK